MKPKFTNLVAFFAPPPRMADEEMAAGGRWRGNFGDTEEINLLDNIVRNGWAIRFLLFFRFSFRPLLSASLAGILDDSILRKC